MIIHHPSLKKNLVQNPQLHRCSGRTVAKPQQEECSLALVPSGQKHCSRFLRWKLGPPAPLGYWRGFLHACQRHVARGRAFRSSLALGKGWLLACPLASRVDTFPVSISPGIIQGPGDRRRVFLFRPLLGQRGFPQEEL